MTKIVNGLNIVIVPVGKLMTNCYIIYNDSKEAIVIDPGADADKIKLQLKQLGVYPKAILLTHAHFDHIMAANEIADEYGITVYAGANEKRLLEDGMLNGSMYYLRQACVVDKFELLSDRNKICIGGIDIEVIYTPGHTEGSVCYYIDDAKVMFTGDTLFRESMGRTDMPTGDETEIIESLYVLMQLNDEVIVYPGHGEDSTIGYERKNNPYID